MDVDLSDRQAASRQRAVALGRHLSSAADAGSVVADAGHEGLLDVSTDLACATVAVEALTGTSSWVGMVLALHLSVVLSVAGDRRFGQLRSGAAVGALALSSDDLPVAREGRLSGRAAWVAPVTGTGLAIVGARAEDGELAAFVLSLDGQGVGVERLDNAGLEHLVCASLTLNDAMCEPIGSTVPVMTQARVLVAAAAVGIGRRALAEALAAAKQSKSAAAGEQTVQGLLADAATELDAAALLVAKAADDGPATLGAASMAKLAAVSAAQGAVVRATQVIGADSFRRGHIVERLSRDVRALELFAGRTEALRAAVAAETLPQ